MTINPKKWLAWFFDAPEIEDEHEVAESLTPAQVERLRVADPE